MPRKKPEIDPFEQIIVESAEELEALLKAEKKRSKYGNIHTELDGYTFDSQAEARRYFYLKVLRDDRQIDGLKVHPQYTLFPAFVDVEGKDWPAIIYEADFEYYDLTGRRIVEDVKGVETDVFKLKAALFRWKYQHSTVFRIIPAGEV